MSYFIESEKTVLTVDGSEKITSVVFKSNSEREAVAKWYELRAARKTEQDAHVSLVNADTNEAMERTRWW